MAISRTEYRQAQGRFLTLAPVDTTPDGDVSVVTVEIDGVGCSLSTGRPRVTYRLLIDVARLRSELPAVWVLEPSDAAITHVNIYRAATCSILGGSYPHLCWGSFPAQWSEVAAEQRTLLALLEFVAQHLNNPNFASRAR